ncbi:hypothetical protein [Candidatus Pseudoruminococcus sp.]|uniref:hypothetical protein n=1 Tax=Candidatus Pseudoruminococcus sp. TaxID=3101048 RepID=UPI00399AB3AF
MSKKCSFLYGTLAVVLGIATSGSMVGSVYATNYSGSETIDLSADITDGIIIKSGANITLNLNGHTISTTESEDTIYVENGATLTISGDGEITNIAGKANIFNNGVVTINGGKITHTGSYYAILNHGEMIIEDATVTSTSEGNSMVVNGYYNYTSTDERIGYVEGKGIANPTMTINGGTFTGDIKNCIYKGDDGSINNISGGTFSGAAACVLQNVNEMTISGGDFTNNNSGYPVINNQYYDDEIDKGVVTIEGGNFTSADENSPLFENGDNSTIEISGGSYSLEPDEEFIVDGIGFNQQDNNRWEIDAPEEPETLPTVTEEQNPATADDILTTTGILATLMLGLLAIIGALGFNKRRA